MMAPAGPALRSRAARRACKNKDKSPETETRPDRAGRLRRAKALPKPAWEDLPPYVQACAANRHRKRPYFVYVWNPDNPNKKTRIDYFCRSWRCPYCRHHESHVLYSRVREAFDSFNAADIVFIVLTLDPREHQRGKTALAQVYREFTRRGAKLLKRVRRWMTKNGMKPFGSEWVSTIEAHRSGVPHINYMVHSPELAAFFRADAESRRVAGESSVESIIIRDELRQHLEACGFGWRSTAEAVRLDGDAVNGVSKLAGYITKIAGNTEKTHGELAKLSQVPLMAPKNFRRLRSGKKLLPKRRKGDGTGALLRRYPSREGDEVAEAVTRSFDPEYMAHVRACVRQEQELVFEDERRVGTNRFCTLWGLPLRKAPPVQAFLLPASHRAGATRSASRRYAAARIQESVEGRKSRVGAHACRPVGASLRGSAAAALPYGALFGRSTGTASRLPSRRPRFGRWRAPFDGRLWPQPRRVPVERPHVAGAL